MAPDSEIEVESRMNRFGLLIVVLFLALAGRLAFLQTAQREELTARAEANYVDTVVTPATRGRVLDRYGRVLIDNLPVNVVRLDATKIPRGQRTRVLSRLASLLERPYADLERALRKPEGDPPEIARGIKESTILYLQEHRAEFPGLVTDQTWQRVYPHKKLGAHVLGYVGKINSAELDRLPDDLRYQASDLIGKEGIEKSFERELRGVPGEDVVIRDSSQQVVSRETKRKPIPGSDVRLTISLDAQRLVEDSLALGIRAARQNYFVEYKGSAKSGPIKATSGAAVVSDVNTGEVVAMASYPSFDPREFVDGMSPERYAQLTCEECHSPFTNRAIAGAYPPGSTFKLVTALAALQAKKPDGSPLLTPGQTIVDPGFYRIESLCGLNVRCRWSNAGDAAFGTISLRSAMRVSSDTYFYKQGHEFTKLEGEEAQDGIQTMAKALGLGSPTNIRLPGEKSGIVPDRHWMKAINKRFPKLYPRGRWQLGDTINVSIGQGDVLVTPLQLNRAYGAFANGGAVLDQRIHLDVISRDPSAPTTTAPPTTVPETTTTVPPAAPPTVAPNERAPFTSSSIAPLAVGADGLPVTTTTIERVDQTDGSFTATPSVAPELLNLPPVTTTTMPPVKVAPIVEGQIELPDELREPIVAGLRDVVSVRGGTALKAFTGFPLGRYPIAGKTGTAQKINEQDYAVFVAFGPLPTPQYVVTVILEEGGYGRQAAAVVRRIFEGLAGFEPGPVRVVTDSSRER
jgi:penicillin-binding protein 2